MAQVWVATGPINAAPNIRAYNRNDIVSDEVNLLWGLEAKGLVVRREVDLATSGPTHGVDPATQDELDALVTGAGRLSEASLRAAFAAPTAGGNRVVVDGESTTLAVENVATETHGYSWPLYAQLLSGSRINVVRNAAIGGTTIAQVLARFDTGVTPYAPNTVVLTEGTNDVLNATTFAAWSAGIAAYHAKCKAIGARLILGTIPPNNTAANKPVIAKWNAWLKRYALLNGLSVIDFHAVLSDPGTGGYIAAANSTDGLHPAESGYQIMGAEAARVLAPLLPYWAPPLVRAQNDTINLLTGGQNNALLMTDDDTNGVPNGWTASGGTGYTDSLVTDPNVPGKLIRISAASGATGTHVVTRSLFSGFAIGDRLAFCGVVSSSGIQGRARVKCQYSGSGGKSLIPAEFTGVVTRGVFYAESVVPTGTTQIDVSVQAEPGAIAGAATVDLGQPTLLNLTQLGLL